MISVQQINLTVQEKETIYCSNGAVAATILSGKYIVKLNVGQQNGWYSLHTADEGFSAIGPIVANVYLAFGTNGRVFLAA